MVQRNVIVLRCIVVGRMYRIGNIDDKDWNFLYRDFVKFRLFAVEKKRVWFPYLGQKLPVHRQLLDTCDVVAESRINPRLSKVAVQIE